MAELRVPVRMIGPLFGLAVALRDNPQARRTLETPP
jgi:hypothetical protein